MKKTLVLCDGIPPSRPLFEDCREWADFFLAADGGAHTAIEFKSLPDVVIGDLDSYRPTNAEPYKVIFDPGQETNDLEKALTLALRENSTHILVLGATGRRLDHTLKNLSVLKKFDRRFEELRLKDDFGDTFLLPKTFSAEIPPGTGISLFPLSGEVTGITTKGLKYPLNDESLENGVRDGSSNEVIDSHVEISHRRGDLIIFITKVNFNSY